VKKAKKIAKDLKIKFKEIDFSKKHLEIIKSPKYGYGSSMNPCIDCHALMLKFAKNIIKKEKADFVVTGEVLGERPMSQNRKALELLEKESSLTGFLLRPLSAKLLKPTIAEKQGLIDRSKLFDISGRSRKRQLALAKKFKIKNYLTPSGGCLLTDLEFGKKLKDLFKIYPLCAGNDIELLKLGRHFLENKTKIIVGRNLQENLKIKKLARKNDILIELKKYPGPFTLIRNYGRGKILNKVLEKAEKLTKYYSLKAREKKDVEFEIIY
jgi:tRNA U34 2-thiouridine synthase MnmA/TrmU